MSGGERRLAAIMYTDIVGYTALTQLDESRAMEVLERHNQLLRPFFPKFHGKEVKAIGDSFLVEFESALDALKCATEIQSYLHDYNVSSKEEWKIKLRIGIHLGDVIHRVGDIFGDAVNIASRIEPIATPEGICVSQQVYDQVQNKLHIPLVSLGEKSLKNVSAPVAVYSVVMPWEEDHEKVELVIQGDSRRIAVLPFVSMSPDPNDEYFADGLTDELITRISLVRGLEVIARTSIMNYKKKEKNASQIGKELKVGTLLEGSVRKAGSRIRVSAQLINANTEGHLWAENYDRNLEDIFEVQSSVAEKVAGALKLKLLDEEKERVESTNNIEAYTLYLKAIQLLNEVNETNCREAIALLKDAISKDPTFVRAYAELASAWWSLGSGWADFTTCVNMAEAAARKALELGPESAEAHLAMADAHHATDRFEEALSELEKAIRINPNLADANSLLGQTYGNFGRFDEAIQYYRKACSLDPLNVAQAGGLIMVLRVSGKADEALEVAKGARELHRRTPWIYLQTAHCYLQMKDFANASEVLADGLRFNPNDRHLRATRGMAYTLSGKKEEAIDELRDLMKDESESTRLRAQVWIGTALGDLDQAFKALMREAETHDWWPFIKFDPLFEGLQNDPRFPEFCKKVGLLP